MREKLVFFDDFWIAARPGTERRSYSPVKLGEFHDAEASLQIYTSFFYDPSVGKYRLYYEVPIPNRGTEIRILKLAEADRVEDFLTGKVEISAVQGLDEEHGMHGCGVTMNPCEADPAKRYLLLGNAHVDDREKRYFCRSFSADGVNFSKPTRVYPRGEESDYKDTYNSVYYNPYRKEYLATTRCATVDRRIALIRSKDGTVWSKPEMILHPASNGNTGTQYYALGVSQLGGLFYGILWRFITNLDQPDFTDMGGVMENDLLYSYDGHCFIPTGCTPLCERPQPPEYGCEQLWLLNIAEEGDRYILCGGASNVAHGSSYRPKKFAMTVLYEIRKDRFCALEGTGKDSVVYTKPILLEGGEICLNFNALGGSISVAILDHEGKAFPGFGFEDCVSFTHEDSTEGRVRFKHTSADSLIGQRVRFAIRLDGACLYSLSLDGRPHVYRKPQDSFHES